MTAHDDADGATEVDGQTDEKVAEGYEPPTRPPSSTTPLEMRVTRADNGFEVSFDELMHSGEHPLLWSVDERMRLTRRRVTARVSIRTQQVSG